MAFSAIDTILQPSEGDASLFSKIYLEHKKRIRSGIIGHHQIDDRSLNPWRKSQYPRVASLIISNTWDPNFCQNPLFINNNRVRRTRVSVFLSKVPCFPSACLSYTFLYAELWSEPIHGSYRHHSPQQTILLFGPSTDSSFLMPSSSEFTGP